MIVRGIFYEGWRMAARPARRHCDEFLGHVERELAAGLDPDPDPERATRAVLAVLYERIDLGETLKAIRSLPRELRELWPKVAVED